MRELFLVILVFLGGCLGPGDVQIANWPQGYKSAAVVTFEVERATGGQMRALAEALDAEGVNATFFVISGYYEDNPEDLDVLKDYEVANMGWFQGQWTEKELTPQFQAEEILKSHVWLLERGFEVRGFRAPFLTTTPETYKILEGLGYTYDSSKYYGFLPYMIGDVVEIPLSTNFDLFWDDYSMAYSSAPAYLAFQKSQREGGLFTFYGHAATTSERLQNFTDLLDYMGARDVWFASGNEVADWWLKREQLELNVQGKEITVVNRGDDWVRGATVRIAEGRTIEGAITVKEGADATYAVLPDIEPQGEVRVTWGR